MRLRRKYAWWGALLGLGSPLGSLAWHVLSRSPGASILWTILEQWRSDQPCYIYMTVGTVTAFGLFGYMLGRDAEGLNELSVTDGLTGLYNHRYLHEQLVREIHRSDRYHAPLTCLMLDIDDFKKVNDHYGHPFGDKVLAATGDVIRRMVRKTDLVGRYGGEEFLVIMPQTTSETAKMLADRVLQAVQSQSYLPNGTNVHVTVSIGLATYPALEQGVKAKNGLLSAVDQALYEAKRSGKNKTVIWKP